MGNPKHHSCAVISLYFCISLSAIAAPPTINTQISNLKRDAQRLQSTMDKSRECFPSSTPRGTNLCTGVVLKSSLEKKMMTYTVEKCQQEILQHGYQPWPIGKQLPPKVTPAELQSFLQSQQNALTFHDLKLVLFKIPTQELTCLHELIHVLQHDPSIKSPLAPINRNLATDKIQHQLMEVANKIESLEKSGNVESAKHSADQLAPVLATMDKWTSLYKNLDEIDAHGWIWLKCRDHSKQYPCTPRQLEIAVANLKLLEEYLPSDIKKLINSDGQRILQQNVASSLDVSLDQQASSAATSSLPELKNADDFLTWLKNHQNQFEVCEVTKTSSFYKLCDNTKVDINEIKKLFSMSPTNLVKHFKSLGIKVEILCDQKPGAQTFASLCQTTSPRKNFTTLSSLHGQYLPDEDAILIKSSASKGSLIHEYVHRLESKNQNPIFGKIYKQTRNQIQKNLIKLMDDKIAIITKLEKAGKKEEIKAELPSFMAASAMMQKFAPWQDLIDERNIFLLYLNFGSEFGVAPDDIALAKLNMQHICKQKTWQGKLPQAQCPP